MTNDIQVNIRTEKSLVEPKNWQFAFLGSQDERVAGTYYSGCVPFAEAIEFAKKIAPKQCARIIAT